MTIRTTLLKTLVSLSALAAAAFAAPVLAGSADDALNQETGQFRALATRGAWINPWMPAVAEPSGDARLQAQVAAYTRQAMDRGGWANPWVRDTRYAAGEPLLAVAVGSGVTSRGETLREPVRLLAAR